MLSLCTRLSDILVHAFESSSLIATPILSKNGNEVAAFLLNITAVASPRDQRGMSDE